MKKLIFLLSLFSSTIASAQEIENINFFLEGKNIVITYDFVNCSASDVYDISVVFVEQNQSRVTPVTLSGDIKKVNCGSKRIVWNLLNDREELSGKYQVWLDFKVASKFPVDIEWVEIPAGIYTMGSPNNEIGRYGSEDQHQETISAFRMSKNEITFAQYDIFCEKTGRKKPNDEGWGRNTRPVINVSWEDANAFANWMGCRLPTEAEWEYACRAGRGTPFYTGDNLTTNQSNYDGNYPYNNNSNGQFIGKTLPVGSYPSNSWGLNDMHGNVYEWCSDWFTPYTEGDSYDSYPIIRGGSWSSYASRCRSADLSFAEVNQTSDFIGFRLVVAP